MQAQPIVVVGAGAAGMAAALAAARSGRRVLLLERQPHVGGTVASALIHTLAGLYDSSGELINRGLAQELVDRLLSADSLTRRRRMGRLWVLNVRPEVYRAVVERWLESEERIETACATRLTLAIRQKNHLTEIQSSGPDGVLRVQPLAVIDSTGMAEVVRQLDPSLLEDEGARAAGALIFRLRGVTPTALAFPQSVGVVRALHAAAASGKLPAECDKAWLDTGVYSDEVFVKLFIPLDRQWRSKQRQRELLDRARDTQAAVVAFLRGLPGFLDAQVTQTGSIGVRDGGRVRGEYCLTASDVREGRKFEDAACRGCWPMEYWDPDQGVSLEYLAEGLHYEIPLRSLKVAGVDNLWTAGKCLSADRYAQASARVVGTCWAMGEAAGIAAAATASSAVSRQSASQVAGKL